MRKAPINSRILVCDDLFNRGGTHWQQSMGLGEFIDSDSPANTVLFEDKVKKHVADNEVEVYYPFDRTTPNIEPTQIYEMIDNDVSYPDFRVFRPGETGLFRVRGVTFQKIGAFDIKIP